MTDKYYYQVDGTSFLIEMCKVKNDGTRIGSKKCAECWQCRGIDHEEFWVKCKQIEKATAKPSPAIK